MTLPVRDAGWPSATRSGEGAFYAEIDLSTGLMSAPMTVWLTGEVVY